MNIVLIGYRGTGKSEAARLLSGRLGMESVSMDAEIVKRAGMTVPQIVEREGWPGFRDRESRLAEELALRDNFVIDCGGGIIERPENVEALRQKGRLFWLKARVDTIVSRIAEDTQRPSLTGGKSFTDEVAEVLERRTPLYRKAAHFEIETDGLTPQQVADRIAALFEKG